MKRAALVGSVCALIGVVAMAWGGSTPEASRATTQDAHPPSPNVPLMNDHFELVTGVHAAIVSGDLEGAQRRARQLAEGAHPVEMPPAAAPYITALRRAAGRAAAANGDPEDVAAATAAMRAACGDCHRAVGTMPVMPRPPGSEVGGLVGHMLAHKTAADLMVQGLTIPSTAAWREGARMLETAPLDRGELPRDRKLTRAIAAEELRVHALASRAGEAPDQRSRIYVYSELLQSCSACHALHKGVWGPAPH